MIYRTSRERKRILPIFVFPRVVQITHYNTHIDC